MAGIGETLIGLAAGAGLNLGSSDWQMRKQIKAQKELIDYQNKYNSPANQMRLYKEAGLSPALVAASGASGGQVSPSATPGSVPVDPNSGSSLVSAASGSSLAHEQMKNLSVQNKMLEQEVRGKQIENDVREAQSKEEIAKANTEYNFYSMRDEEAYKAFVDDWNSNPPDSDHDWKSSKSPDSDFNYWYYTDKNGNDNYVVNVPNLYGLSRRFQNIKFGYDTSRAETENRKINNSYLKFQTDLYKKYGDKVEKAKLDQANAIIRNAMIQGNINELDYNTFSKLGLGPNVIRSILGFASQFANLENLMMGAGAMMSK